MADFLSFCWAAKKEKEDEEEENIKETELDVRSCGSLDKKIKTPFLQNNKRGRVWH